MNFNCVITFLMWYIFSTPRVLTVNELFTVILFFGSKAEILYTLRVGSPFEWRIL